MEVDITKLTPDVRHLRELEKVAYDRDWYASAGDADMYMMYRGIEEKDGIRYDITVVPARMMGKEFAKTKGHYHKGNYGEVYTVLEGEAIYVMQKLVPGSENEIEDVYAVKAQKGDVVVIPSNYGHITINPSSAELKMANWVATACQSDYSLYEKFQGGCYYYTSQGWIKNERYASVPALRFEEPDKEVPKNLDFLKAA